MMLKRIKKKSRKFNISKNILKFEFNIIDLSEKQIRK